MDQNQGETLSLKAAYGFGAEHGLQQEVDEIRDMVIEWDRSYTSSLRRGYIVDLFEKRGIFEEFKKSCWENGNTPAGESKRGAIFGSSNSTRISWPVTAAQTKAPT